MEESILTSTKKLLNVSDDDTAFDQQILTYINTAFSRLHHLGVGPVAGFAITDATSKWTDFVEGPIPVLSEVKNNIGLRVRRLFDPSQFPHVLQASKEELDESDWRLNVMREEAVWVAEHPVDEIVESLEGP